MTSEKYFFERDKFELPVRHLFEKLVKPGWIVYEIGGHIGYWALVLSRLVGARGHVYVFEPSPVNFPRLLRNIEANNLHNITAHNLAVSEKNGPIGFSENGSMSRVGGSPLNPVVQSVRLDDFMRAAPPPQLMLVDAEGHGSQIFRGADELLRTVRPHLVYETHDQGEQRETDEILSKHGYRFDWIDRKDGFPARINATYGSLT
jgi:FkbM family methyltransferase